MKANISYNYQIAKGEKRKHTQGIIIQNWNGALSQITAPLEQNPLISLIFSS